MEANRPHRRMPETRNRHRTRAQSSANGQGTSSHPSTPAAGQLPQPVAIFSGCTNICIISHAMNQTVNGSVGHLVVNHYLTGQAIPSAAPDPTPSGASTAAAP